MSDPDSEQRRAKSESYVAELTAIRRDIHQHPEMAYEENRTADIVAKNLEAWGLEVDRGLGKTGVVGTLRRGDSNRAIGLRADMDALPIHEQTGLDYASKTPNAMHACGHDGHTAMLLGASRYLAETRNFDGTAEVIFQPAEEGGGGGREMCDDGMMDRWNIDEVYGMHNWPGMTVGTFSIRPGVFFAATDLLKIEFEGLGGHAAKPHETVDTTLMAAHAVTALQSIVSRHADPIERIVVSITAFSKASTAFKALPPTVQSLGSVCRMSPTQGDLAR